MNLRVVASLLGRGKQLERLSDGLTLLALAYGLAPLLGAPLQPLASLLCGVLLVLGVMPNCSPTSPAATTWQRTPRPWTAPCSS